MITKFCYLQPAGLRALFSKTSEEEWLPLTGVPAELSPAEAVSKACHQVHDSFNIFSLCHLFLTLISFGQRLAFTHAYKACSCPGPADVS